MILLRIITNKIAAPIDTIFLFREQEIVSIEEAYQDVNANIKKDSTRQRTRPAGCSGQTGGVEIGAVKDGY
jgi:hypothetical protein